jgi:hypothetical protein
MKTFDESIMTLAVTKKQRGTTHEEMMIANVDEFAKTVNESDAALDFVTSLFEMWFGGARQIKTHEMYAFGLACMTAGAQIGVEMEKP